MGRRASTSQLEVKHGNFSAIKSPSRGASPAASPRASPAGSPNRRLSEGAPAKDVRLSREAYSKARNLLLAKHTSAAEELEIEEHEDGSGGFKRVGKALVSGMHQALFNRRGSAKNQGLMKSLMAAISKEKILNRISELGLDDQVSEMLGEMYQGMMELLIDDYEPLEGALGALLDEAVTGNEDLESLIADLREAVTGSLMAMLSKQEPFGVEITRAQEILLDKVVEAARGMASEISYTMRMRGGGKKKRMSAPSGSNSLLSLGDSGLSSQRLCSSAGMGMSSSGRATGSGSASEGASGYSVQGTKHHGADTTHHFKKTVRNMFMMKAIGGGGPRFHTERRAEERKHHQPGTDAFEDEDGEDQQKHQNSLGAATARTEDAAIAERNNLEQPPDPSASSSMSLKGGAQVTFDGLSNSSRSGSNASGQRPNTVAVEQEAVESQSVSEAGLSPSSRSLAQSYGMEPSSESGLSSPSPSVSTKSPTSSKARSDATHSLNPFGLSDTTKDASLAQEELWAKMASNSQGRSGLLHISSHAPTENNKVGLQRMLADSDQILPQEERPQRENAAAAPTMAGDFQRRPQPKGRGGQLIHGRNRQNVWSEVARGKMMQNDRGDLFIGHHPGRRGHKGGFAGWDDGKHYRTGKVSTGAMPRIGISNDLAGNRGESLALQSFDWETLRVQLLREGIKLKIPPELLHKKGVRSREQSQARLEEVQADFHEAAFREDMARLHESSKELEASLFDLKSDRSGKSLHGSTWHADSQSGQANLFSAQPVSASCNATLHRAWKLQDPVELEEVYQRRASRWEDSGAPGALPETTRHVPSLGLVPLVGQRAGLRRRKSWRAWRRKPDRPLSGARRFKQPILPFRSTCFDFSTDRLLPEIVTFPMVTEDFMESVYSLSLEHSRASWSDTNTLIESPAKPAKPAKRGRGPKSLQNFHKHFKSVMP